MTTYTTAEAKARLNISDTRRALFYRLKRQYPRFFVIVKPSKGGYKQQTVYDAAGIDRLAELLTEIKTRG